jgi:four helix bundle protein
MAGVTSFEELDAWKLSVELRDLVYTLIEKGRVLRDPNFCEQIRNSASSAPSNIAEGWGRFKPRQHASYLLVAKASLEETKNHLLHGRKNSYFSMDEFNQATKLARRALGATVRLHQYLESCKGRLPWEDPPKRTPKPRDAKTPPEGPVPNPEP